MKNVLFKCEVIADNSLYVSKRMSAWFIYFSSLMVCFIMSKEVNALNLNFCCMKRHYFLIGVKLLISLKKRILVCKSQSIH